MSDDKLAELNKLLSDPFRQKILLKLGEHNGLSLDTLMKELKVDDQQLVLNQLKVLGDLVSKTEDEYLLNEQGVEKKTGEQYVLTERGLDAVTEMIAYPEIKAADYKEKIDEKFHSKQAYQNRKITYTLAGAAGGFSAFFFLSAFFTIFSRLFFNSPGFFFGDGLYFAFALLVVAPAIGGILGYLIGVNRDFKRPEPEWNE